MVAVSVIIGPLISVDTVTAIVFTAVLFIQHAGQDDVRSHPHLQPQATIEDCNTTAAAALSIILRGLPNGTVQMAKVQCFEGEPEAFGRVWAL